MKNIQTGDKPDTFPVLQCTKRISHTLDDIDTNVLDLPAWFSLVDDTTTGDIMIVLWNENVSEKAVMPAQQAHRDNILVRKIYRTGTDVGITAASFTLYR